MPAPIYRIRVMPEVGSDRWRWRLLDGRSKVVADGDAENPDAACRAAQGERLRLARARFVRILAGKS